jgi:predicted amidohydrolase YtcJ
MRLSFYSGVAAVCMLSASSAFAGTNDAPTATFADTVYLNGNVETMVDQRPVSEAVAVSGSKILGVGSVSDVTPLIGPNTKKVDLQGATVLPGFIDPHSHMAGYSFFLADRYWTDISSTNLYFKPLPSDPRCTTPNDPQKCFIPVQTQEDVLDRLRVAAALALQPGGTGSVYGADYDPSRLGHGKHCHGDATKVGFECPNFENGHARRDLDEISDAIPIVVASESGHIAYANTAALKELNICGVLPEYDASTCYMPTTNVAQETALAKLGQLDEDLTLYTEGFYDEKVLKADPEGTISNFVKAAGIYAQHGYTLVQEGAANMFEVNLYLDVMKLDATFPLTAAMVLYNASADFQDTLSLAQEAQAAINNAPTVKAKDYIFINALKSFADGSPQGYTADISQQYHELFSPFTQPSIFTQPYTGLPDSTADQLTARVIAAHKAGYPMMIHQNGDVAITNSVAALTAAHKAVPGTFRDIVLHAPFLTDDTLRAIKDLNDPISFLISNIHFWGLPLCQQVLGPDYMTHRFPVYPARDALNMGLHVTLHSDSPVDPPYPLFMVWVAKTRNAQQPTWYPNTNPNACPAEFIPSQAISIREGIQAFTTNAAWQYGRDQEMGTIESGKYADLVILSADPMSMENNPDDLKTIRTIATVRHGAYIANPNAADTPVWPE